MRDHSVCKEKDMGQRKKRVKGYWTKLNEMFNNGTEAKSRAGHLRSQENVAHVTLDRVDEKYVVSYSVAKWYLDELDRIGIKL